MKLYILTENKCEYNDNDYDLEDAGTPIAAYRNKENAVAECEKRNLERIKSGDYPVDRCSYNHNNPEYFSVTEVEVEDQNAITYSDKLTAAKAAKEEASKLAKAHLDAGLKKIFSDHPRLIAFKWSQYTPYFNDGDTCEFGINDAYYKFDDTEEEDGDYGDGFQSVYSYKGNEEPAHKVAARDAVQKLMGSVDEKDIKTLFGDHVEITASRDGFVVEEYSHD